MSAGAAASGIAILLLVGLLLRLTIAYVLLPGSGFESDLGTFTAWAYQLGQQGPGSFYATASFADYPPGYLYVLWLIGGLGHLLAPLANGDAASVIGSLIKVPPILADITVGYILYRLVLSWRGESPAARRVALLVAGLYVLNPVTWYDSAIWGQTDAIGGLVLLLCVAALIRGNAEGATALAVLAALIKPQFGVVALPIVGVVLLRRHLLRGEMPHNPVLLPSRLRGWFEFEQGPWRLVSSAVVGLMLMIVVLWPFSLDIPGYISQMVKTAGGYPYLTVNAYNPWAMIGSGGKAPFAFGGGWSSDTIPLLGPIPGVIIGGALLAVGFGLGALRLGWLADRRSILIVTIVLALGFFILPTRVHERYMFPIFAFLPLLAAVNRRWLAAFVLLSIGAFINMHGVLTTPLYATPNLDNMILGDLFRSPLGIITSVVLNVVGFAFVAWSLRPQAAAEPDGYASPVPVEDALDEDAGELEPELPAEPWWAPLTALVPPYSVRRDRSALLAGELGGRLGRRDLLLIVLVFLSAFFLRAYRLEQPYSMHFDEVYHARTAIEFLQDWRYGKPHTIYEFTHPHLAKYGMALGIEALGNNRVTATTTLGRAASDAVIETRWYQTGSAAHLGDRLYVASGSDVGIYDLSQPGPALIATIPGAFVAVAVDDTNHVLYLAEADGTLAQLPTAGLDDLRQLSLGAQPEVLQAAPFGSVDRIEGDLGRLVVSGDQLIAISNGSAGHTLVSIDTSTGAETGRRLLTSVNEVVPADGHSLVVVDPSEVTDQSALAVTLADLLNDDASRIETLIAGATGPVPVAGLIGSTTHVSEAINNGELEGVSVADGPAIAVASDTGVTFLDAPTLAPLKAVATDQPVTGIAIAEQGPDKPTLFGASGDGLILISLGADQAAALSGTVDMPNVVSDVYWNPATTMIHALGLTQNGSSPTIYVVEPRGRTVFADAPLAFDPQVVVVDAQPLNPAEDRDDLLALAPDGQMATIDVGNNQFAYRFPGVLLGALTAALIYLLARFLFRRRSVAIIAALFVLVDGMFFANSRIAMNDTYVAFFIVAAFTVFVPLWLGRWRSRWAIGGGLLAVGILLGLALASKWVGAYAIGAIGLLILLRSALGRWIALMAMIAMTGLLGYIAIAPNPAIAEPHLNYLFLGLMIALTVALAIGITVRLVRLTADELRLLIAGPILAGAAALLFGAYRLATDTPLAAQSSTPARAVAVGVVLVVLGLIAFVVGRIAAGRGRGPWAAPALIDPDAVPESPPPPRGWLRPGSGFLGLSWILALLVITALPLAVYVISYIPWLELGNRLTDTWPPGNTGQTFLDLQRSMYDYHNNLRATHPASSPWWAWPLDLKPVWFEQNNYANGTTAVIYDTGNIVIFWLAIPAVAWLCWQAWQRRSLALTFLIVAIASLWLPWARIDRATFQYHIFTTLPFSFMALAYFLAELWHGPSARTWMLAKVAAAVAIIGAPLLWMLRLPLCSIANTEQVNSGTEVCAALSRSLTLTDLQVIGIVLAVVGLVFAGLLVYAALVRRPIFSSTASGRLLLPIAFAIALLGVVIVVIGAGLPGTPVFTATVSAEEPAFVALVLLSVPAYFVLRATDPRRYVVGTLAAATVWFVAFYPNFASLPVPTALSQIHLGLLPTWNWGFQFGVNPDDANRNPLDLSSVLMLTVLVAGLCVAAVYLVRSWRSLRSEREEISPLAEPG